jgi:type VI secretion system secreted protein VgrG
MRSTPILLTTLATILLPCALARAQFLGTAADFAVLGGSTITSTGPTVITGNAGVWPGSAATGFPPAIILGGTLHLGDAVAQQAHADANSAFSTLAGMARTAELTGTDLGGLVLTPGTYFFASSAQLTSTLTLNALGNPDAVFIFQIGSTLTTASNASIIGINGAFGGKIFWQVGSSATLGTATAFQGTIIAQASITLTTGASILDGRAIALTGAVTLDSNSVSLPTVPTPGGSVLLGSAALALCGTRRRRIA